MNDSLSSEQLEDFKLKMEQQSQDTKDANELLMAIVSSLKEGLDKLAVRDHEPWGEVETVGEEGEAGASDALIAVTHGTSEGPAVASQTLGVGRGLGVKLDFTRGTAGVRDMAPERLGEGSSNRLDHSGVGVEALRETLNVSPSLV